MKLRSKRVKLGAEEKSHGATWSVVVEANHFQPELTMDQCRLEVLEGTVMEGPNLQGAQADGYIWITAVIDKYSGP